jgi:hypothetical protein
MRLLTRPARNALLFVAIALSCEWGQADDALPADNDAAYEMAKSRIPLIERLRDDVAEIVAKANKTAHGAEAGNVIEDVAILKLNQIQCELLLQKLTEQHATVKGYRKENSDIPTGTDQVKIQALSNRDSALAGLVAGMDDEIIQAKEHHEAVRVLAEDLFSESGVPAEQVRRRPIPVMPDRTPTTLAIWIQREFAIRNGGKPIKIPTGKQGSSSVAEFQTRLKLISAELADARATIDAMKEAVARRDRTGVASQATRLVAIFRNASDMHRAALERWEAIRTAPVDAVAQKAQEVEMFSSLAVDWSERLRDEIEASVEHSSSDLAEAEELMSVPIEHLMILLPVEDAAAVVATNSAERERELGLRQEELKDAQLRAAHEVAMTSVAQQMNALPQQTQRKIYELGAPLKHEFASAAHFAEYYDQSGRPVGGMTVYQGMTITIQRDGSYEVRATVGKPSKPLTLHIAIDLDFGVSLAALELAPYEIARSEFANHGGRQSTRTLVWKGVIPHWSQHQAEVIVSATRQGEAQFGFGYSGFDLSKHVE